MNVGADVSFDELRTGSVGLPVRVRTQTGPNRGGH